MKRIFILIISGLIVGCICSPSADAAKKGVVKSAKKIEGGANQITGVEGKIGQMMFNGATRFKVLSLSFPKVGYQGAVPDPGRKFFQIDVELRNGTLQPMDYPGGITFNVVDQTEHIWPIADFFPYHFNDENPGVTTLLPGAGYNVTFIGQINKGVIPKRMIVTAGWTDENHPPFRITFPDLTAQAKEADKYVKASDEGEGASPQPANETPQVPAEQPQVPALPSLPSLPGQ